MIIAFHFIVCFFLITFQTTVLVDVSVSGYDLMAPFIVYLAIHQGPRKALPVIFFGGLVMDGISGGIFGVYSTIYLWMYVGVRWAIQFLHVGNVVLLPLLVAAGIFFECLVSAFCAVVLSSSNLPDGFIVTVLVGQLIWGVLTGPLIVFLLLQGLKSVERAQKRIVGQKQRVANH